MGLTIPGFGQEVHRGWMPAVRAKRQRQAYRTVLERLNEAPSLPVVVTRRPQRDPRPLAPAYIVQMSAQPTAPTQKWRSERYLDLLVAAG